MEKLKTILLSLFIITTIILTILCMKEHTENIRLKDRWNEFHSLNLTEQMFLEIIYKTSEDYFIDVISETLEFHMAKSYLIDMESFVEDYQNRKSYDNR